MGKKWLSGLLVVELLVGVIPPGAVHAADPPEIIDSDPILFLGDTDVVLTEGEEAGYTKLYWDENKNGVVDSGEQPLAIDSTSLQGDRDKGYDLSGREIAAGTLAYPYPTPIEDVHISMTGGTIDRLSGSYMSPVEGDVTISVTGGRIVGANGQNGIIAAVNFDTASVGGDVSISIGGSAFVAQAVYSGSVSGNGSFAGKESVTISGNAVIGSESLGTCGVFAGGQQFGDTCAGGCTLTVTDGSIVGDLGGSGYRGTKFGGDVTVNLTGGSVSGNLIGCRASTPAPKYAINMSGGVVEGSVVGSQKCVAGSAFELNLTGGTVRKDVIGMCDTGAWSGGINLGGGQIDGQLMLRKTAEVQAPTSGGITLQGQPAFGASGSILLREGEVITLTGPLTGSAGGIRVAPQVKAVGTAVIVPANEGLQTALRADRFTGVELNEDTALCLNDEGDVIAITGAQTLAYDLGGAAGTPPVGGLYYPGESVTLATAPSREGYAFQGWKVGDSLYAAGGSLAMPRGAVTLIAQWAPAGNLDVSVSDETKPLPGALVVVKEGEKILQSQVADGMGKAVFNDLPYGVYTLEVTCQNSAGIDVMRTCSVSVEGDSTSVSVSFKDAQLRLNTQISGSVPVAADGLEEAVSQAEKEAIRGASGEGSAVEITVTLTAEPVSENAPEREVFAGPVAQTDHLLLDYFDLSLTKTLKVLQGGVEVERSAEPIVESPGLLTVYLPMSGDLADQLAANHRALEDIVVWRQHGDTPPVQLARGSAASGGGVLLHRHGAGDPLCCFAGTKILGICVGPAPEYPGLPNLRRCRGGGDDLSQRRHRLFGGVVAHPLHCAGRGVWDRLGQGQWRGDRPGGNIHLLQYRCTRSDRGHLCRESGAPFAGRTRCAGRARCARCTGSARDPRRAGIA
ncbi:hypothetical protein GT748_00285 [Bittarella massiliensis]|uniref:Repeat domain (List_Bact_rpt) n=1 Tax=Bittarella massiliensis (ex Durand et al. 2017) TaxID=1720313 RepID=A0AAQ1RWT8_9FIRM|nr:MULTISPECIES: InlB B-repeat-containing protein [Eubacteriales]ERJ00738.1 repeat protein [Clostridium sp. ATCC 29733]MZL69384.1 hypothetical protein [Bittarella massiliensis (ex Durand et al. 2017)]MZL79074.1 hypothetical protein [Bittarella massiliensis (ex Durand et al. 2017)]SHG45700.1 repeat domain (List_Bact_rpt) [Bittarella massiliensis (ex Durand et al. 2017)]